MSIPIRSVLSRKGFGVRTVRPDELVLNLADSLVSNHIGAVPVVDENGTLIGLVSERDIVIGLSEHHDEVGELTAGDIMARKIHTCSPDCTVTDAMQTMTLYRQRHIPILEDGKLVGLVSIGDLVKYRLEEADHFVEEMRAYVMQSEPAHASASGHHALR